MNIRKYFFAFIFIMIIIVILYSCKDMGIEPHGLSASKTNVSVVKGTSAQITLSGGVAPYTIIKQPDNTIATVSLSASVLTISGVDTGSTNMVVADSKTPIADSLRNSNFNYWKFFVSFIFKPDSTYL